MKNRNPENNKIADSRRSLSRTAMRGGNDVKNQTRQLILYHIFRKQPQFNLFQKPHFLDFWKTVSYMADRRYSKFLATVYHHLAAILPV